jgi:integrase
MKTDAKATIKSNGYEMSCGFRIRLLQTKAGKRYQVDLGRKSGRHVRKNFKALQEARNWAQKKSLEADRKGIAVLQFSDEQKIDAVEALGMLREFGANLRTAAVFYSKHHKKVDRTNGFSPLIDQYLKEQKQRVEKGDLRARTYEDARKRLNPFKEHLGHMAVDVVESQDIDDLMDECGFHGTNRQNYKRYLSGFYNWAVRNKKTPSNPVNETTTIKMARHTPEIYSPTDVKRIVSRAVELHPNLVPYLSIAFFAGVRPEEILRLNWEDIDLSLEEIHIRAGQSKTNSARIVHISRNLTAWLLKYRKMEGLVFPFSESSLARWRSEVYRKAKTKSIQDGARHTFATFHLALHNLDDTLQELGHTDPKMLFRHYRGLAKNRKKQAEEFFSLHPE